MSAMVDATDTVGYVTEPKSQNEVGSSHGAPSSIPVVVDTGVVLLEVKAAVGLPAEVDNMRFVQ